MRGVVLVGVIIIGLLAYCVNQVFFDDFNLTPEVCLESANVGNHPNLDDQIKDRLNDPESYLHIRTETLLIEDSMFAVGVEFTAKNEFGGRIRYFAGATLNTETCAATLLTIERK